jgi:predicted flap endonuclease-1-like 5' DNA nuclease
MSAYSQLPRNATEASFFRQARLDAAKPAVAATRRLAPVRGIRTFAALAAANGRSSVEQPHLKSIKHVHGIGKSYEKLLRQQGIQTVEQLSNRILKELSGVAGDLSDKPAIKYLQVSMPSSCTRAAGQSLHCNFNPPNKRRAGDVVMQLDAFATSCNFMYM